MAKETDADLIPQQLKRKLKNKKRRRLQRQSPWLLYLLICTSLLIILGGMGFFHLL